MRWQRWSRERSTQFCFDCCCGFERGWNDGVAGGKIPAFGDGHDGHDEKKGYLLVFE